MLPTELCHLLALEAAFRSPSSEVMLCEPIHCKQNESNRLRSMGSWHLSRETPDLFRHSFSSARLRICIRHSIINIWNKNSNAKCQLIYWNRCCFPKGNIALLSYRTHTNALGDDPKLTRPVDSIKYIHLVGVNSRTVVGLWKLLFPTTPIKKLNGNHKCWQKQPIYPPPCQLIQVVQNECSEYIGPLPRSVQFAIVSHFVFENWNSNDNNCGFGKVDGSAWRSRILIYSNVYAVVLLERKEHRVFAPVVLQRVYLHHRGTIKI